MSILPRSIALWKKQFLDNISLAFDKSTVVKEYKEKIEVLEKEKDATSKKLGEVIVERDFLEGKLKSSLYSSLKFFLNYLLQVKYCLNHL